MEDEVPYWQQEPLICRRRKPAAERIAQDSVIKSLQSHADARRKPQAAVDANQAYKALEKPEDRRKIGFRKR